jgi:hypothetical protein
VAFWPNLIRHSQSEIDAMSRSFDAMIIGAGRPGHSFRTCSMVGIRELLRAGYSPIRGDSLTRRELRCPVK